MRFGIKKICVFPIKKTSSTLFSYFLREVSDLTQPRWIAQQELISVIYLRKITLYSAHILDSKYDQSVINQIGKMYFWKAMCSGKRCVHKKTFQSLERSDFQYFQFASTCQIRTNPFEDRTKFFFKMRKQSIDNLEATQESIQDIVGDLYCPSMQKRKKCLHSDQQKF